VTWWEERLRGRLCETPAETLQRFYVVAVETVSAAGYCTPHMLQTRFEIGYYRAIVLIKAMQAAGMLGEFDEVARHYPLLEPRGFH
jgi:DNA segregation ATPase FtsK/SpoIIIE-like protein